MALYKFHPDDIFINTLEAYPEFSFYIHSGTVFFDNTPHRQGSNADVPNGFVSLYQINNDRAASQLIYPFLIKGGDKQSFKSISDADYNVKYNYDGAMLTGSYNFSGSIFRDYFAALTTDGTHLITRESLRTSFRHYSLYSSHYAYSSSLGNKATQECGIINIPSIFYGKKIKKGSVQLDYYISGTLVGTLKDENYTGELIQTGPAGSTGSGSVAGVVMYREGLIFLTGSWSLGSSGITYSGSNATGDKWIQFGDGLHQDISGYANLPSASFNLSYQGVTHTNTMTLLAHAKYGELNYSNNPTFKQFGHSKTTGSLITSHSYSELEVPPANITHTTLQDVTPTLQRETYISKVALYDEDKNLIGFAKVATPVRKTEDRQYIFKLKLDL